MSYLPTGKSLTIKLALPSLILTVIFLLLTLTTTLPVAFLLTNTSIVAFSPTTISLTLIKIIEVSLATITLILNISLPYSTVIVSLSDIV